ncbi:MAG: hypothetical protein KY456_14960 [Chloroflexi bacterium]|nr:hypothetical protein [Chloroflexota bacterium]
MSELATLHPFDPAFVARYVAAVQGAMTAGELLPAAPAWAEREIARARTGYARAEGGNEAGANAVSYGLARMLAVVEPVFFLPGLGFTQLEAKFDRGIGMLLRPPSRLFDDAGLPTVAARAMPIRLDASGGIMGGAFMPPAQLPRFRDLLEQRMDRLARRMTEADLDAPAYIGVLLELSTYAADRGLGLFEASDIVVPGVPESEPPGLRLIAPDRKRLDRDLRRRLEEASRPPKQPGLVSRLLGRAVSTPREDNPKDGRRWRGNNDVTPPPESLPEMPDTAREGPIE